MADSNVEYLKLITSEYADKPKFNSFVETFLKQVACLNDNYLEFDNLFNLDKATGDQLDKLGELVNVSRELPISVENIPSILTDDLYRIVIRSRIFSNFWDGTLEGLQEIVDITFPDVAYQIVDNQDMTMQVVIIYPDADPSLIALLTAGYILPKPSGVGVTYTIQENELFGWDSDTAFIKGWDTGIWSST